MLAALLCNLPGPTPPTPAGFAQGGAAGAVGWSDYYASLGADTRYDDDEVFEIAVAFVKLME